ncbi:caspase family protein [Mesorhizobium sp. VK25A]|uniref:Caspase family protein n=1 Tax=Mesorhizobium vachelliae TaxID=3072309 RepID=A0ABU5A4U8_9HYPH|nr:MULTISPECIES: caspase family protein [unclassified Mesorhizobium]MDX8531534.1 caspase family protein [Mesorhizobium sp. VK25D]MDX8544024.1 caspase family protein [Mesorhizobium sp. VK25A]
MLRCCALLAAMILVGLTTFEAHADRRVALVIGNSQYREIPALKNPDKDAEDVSKTFRLAGFEVFAAKDLTRLQFEEKFRNYLAAADGADLAVVYYSGHGFQIGGENFLIPVDASLKDAADMEVQAIKVDDILRQLRSRSKIQMIILDACRNDPFPRKDYWLRDQLIVADGTGLAQVTGSQNTLIAFATEPGAVAYDGSGDLSPFSSAFSRRALTPNQEIRSVMAAVRRDVVKATNGKQVPWENSSLLDDVVLMRGTEQPAAAAPDAEQDQQTAERGIEVAAAAEAMGNRDIRVPVGVGPVPLKLDFPAKGAAISLKLASYPATGTLSLPDRGLSPQSTLTAAEVDKLRYEPQVGSAAPADIGFEIRAGNAARQATVRLSPNVDPCDQAAGEPLDLQGVVPGRLPNEIGSGAVEACETAVKSYPDIARFRYELGRALLTSGRVDEARQAIQEAADKGHIRALFTLGSIASVDLSKANDLYSKASDKGDPYAMAVWGRALFDGLGVQRDTGKGLDLLLQAAAMGHVDAMKNLAMIFKEGRNGVPTDPDRALAFLKAGMERQDVYSMGILGLPSRPARSTPVVLACKAPKVITKIKEVRVPAPKPKTPPKAPVPQPADPVPTDSGRAPWTGSNSSDHPGNGGGGKGNSD